MVAQLENIPNVLPLPLPHDERENILLPRRRRTLVEFAESDLLLTDDSGKVQGPFSWDLTPFWIEPALTLTDTEIDQVTLRKGTQCAGTTLGNIWFAWIVCERPGGFLCVLPTEESMSRRIRRLRGMFRANPDFKRHLGPLHKLTENGAELDNMNLYTGFAGSAVTLSDVPLPNVLLDETGKFPATSGKEGNPVGQARARQRWYYDRMLLVISSPVLEDDVLDNEFNAGDRCEHWVPCPHCRERQVLTWDQYHLDKGQDGHLLEPSQYQDGDFARYVCPHCGCEWTEKQRWTAVQRGVWLPDGMDAGTASERIRIWEEFWATNKPRAEALDHLYDRLRRNHTAVHRSFHLPSFYLYPNVTKASQLAAEYAQAIKYKKIGNVTYLQNFINLQCAEPWKETEKSMSELSLRQHRCDVAVDVVPARAWILTAGVDVQKDGFYVVVIAWGYQWESWILLAEWIDAGFTREGRFIPCKTDQVAGYNSIREKLLQRTWTWDGHSEKMGKMGLSAVGIDSSDGNVTETVYDACNQINNPDLFFPVKGFDNQDLDIVVRELNKDEMRRSRGRRRVYKPGMVRVNYSTLAWKNRLWRWSNNSEPGPGYIHIPEHISDEFERQFTAEELRPIRKRGRTGHIWTLKKRRTANHYWDASVIAAVAGYRAGVGNLRLDDASTQDEALPRRGSRRSDGSSHIAGRF